MGNKKVTKFEIQCITTQQLLKIISKLKPKNSTGQDLLSNKIIKNVFPEIAEAVKHLINLSIKSGIVPP